MERFIEGAENRSKSNQHPSDMKIWLNEFLQNAAFPAIVLAFACSLINNETPGIHKESSAADHRQLAQALIVHGDRLTVVDGARRGKDVP
jgi:hypothetical protein